MAKLTKYHKRAKLTFITAALVCCFLLLFLFNSVGGFAAYANYYSVYIGDEVIGTSNNKETAEKALANARARISSEAESIVYFDSDFSVQKEERLFGATDSSETLEDNIYEKIKEYADMNYSQAYMLSSGEYYLILKSVDDVESVLKSLVEKYDEKDEFTVSLSSIQEGSFTSISYNVIETDTINQAIEQLMIDEGITRTEASNRVHEYETVGFTDELEIRSVYVDVRNILSADQALQKIQNDDISSIGIKTVELANYDEEFDGPIVYVEDDNLYEGQEKVEFAGVKGTRNVDARITYVNGVESGREILNQTVYAEPESAIVHTGTRQSPTFVYPMASFTFTSEFGYRWGAMHSGIDIADAYGTPIYASCAGTVEFAGGDNTGYGINVLIRHDEHIVTRYAHMCEFIVTQGQHVEQFEVIGYEGSTGNSTGPHCHFEIIIDGVCVDPLAYLP